MRANGVVCLDRERPDRRRYAGTLIERLRSLESRGLFGLLNARTSRIPRPRQSATDLPLLVVELVVRMPATVPSADNDHDDHDDDSTYDHDDCSPASASATCDDHDNDHDNDHDDNNADHRSTNHDAATRPGAHRLESSTARASSGLDRTLR